MMYSHPIPNAIETYEVQTKEKVELVEVNDSTVLLDEHGNPKKVQSVG